MTRPGCQSECIKNGAPFSRLLSRGTLLLSTMAGKASSTQKAVGMPDGAGLELSDPAFQAPLPPSSAPRPVYRPPPPSVTPTRTHCPTAARPPQPGDCGCPAWPLLIQLAHPGAKPLHRLPGHTPPRRAAVIPREITSSGDPPNTRVVRVLHSLQRRQRNMAPRQALPANKGTDFPSAALASVAPARAARLACVVDCGMGCALIEERCDGSSFRPRYSRRCAASMC